MADDAASPGTRILRQWQRLRRLPGGKAVFSILLGRQIPYTGTMGARVEELSGGRSRIRLDDRRKVRNHLGSVHAVALANLGELAGGLATITGLPPGIRGIVLRLESEYLKKARGTLTAEAEWIPPRAWPPQGIPLEEEETEDCWVEATIRDREGDEVARVRALWRLGRAR